MNEFSEYNQSSGSLCSRELMKLKTEAVKASVENRLSLFLRRLVHEMNLDENDLRKRVGFEKEPERFDAVLVGVEELSRVEVMKFAKAIAEMCGVESPQEKSGTEQHSPDKWTAYTDGGFRPDAGVGAWAYIVTKNDKEMFRDHGREKDTTSHEMETLAMLNALKRVEKEGIKCASFVSDNKSLVNMIDSGTILPNGWYRGDPCTPIQELYGDIGVIINRNPYFSFEWTKGHCGNPWNEACDALCSHELWKGKVEDISSDDSWVIYTDGMHKNKGNKGSWGYVAVRNGHEAYRKARPSKAASLQEMEVTAVLEAAMRLVSENVVNARIVTDNKCLVDTVKAISEGKKASDKTKTPVQKLTRGLAEIFAKNTTFSLEWSKSLKNDPWLDTVETMCTHSLVKGVCV